MRKSELELRIWNYLHVHPSDLENIIREESVDEQVILSEILLLCDMFQIMDQSFIDRMNLIYQLITDTTNLYDETEKQMITLLKEFKQKFETKCLEK
jgi:isochorismate hydrolase